MATKSNNGGGKVLRRGTAEVTPSSRSASESVRLPRNIQGQNREKTLNSYMRGNRGNR